MVLISRYAFNGRLRISFIPFLTSASYFRYPPPSSQIIPYNPAPDRYLGGEAKTSRHEQALLSRAYSKKLGLSSPQLPSMAAEPVLISAAPQI